MNLQPILEQPQTLGAASFCLAPFKLSETQEPLKQLEDAYNFLDYYIEISKPEMIARFQRDIRVLEEMLLPTTPSLTEEEDLYWLEDDSTISDLLYHDYLYVYQNTETGNTQFKEGVLTKKAAIESLATNKPILNDFPITLPRRGREGCKGYRKEFFTLSEAVVEAMLHKKVARLEGISPRNKKERLVFADFDICPAGFSDFDQLFAILEPHFRGRAIVSYSASNKVKVMFKVANNPQKAEILNFLKNEFNILGNMWQEKGIVKECGKEVSKFCIDRSGLDYTYLTFDMLEVYQEQFNSTPTLYIHDYLYVYQNEEEIGESREEQRQRERRSEEVSKKHEWVSYLGTLKIASLKSKEAIKVLNYILGNPFLAMTKGVFISQKGLEKALGMSQANISRSLSHLKLKGLIEISAPYIQGVRGYGYRVIGEALELCKEIYRLMTGKIWLEAPERIVELENPIQDHCWNEELLNRTKYFVDPVIWMNYIEHLPDIENKNRMEKAISIWNSHARNNGLKEI